MFGYRITQIIFWLALSVYFGGLTILGSVVAAQLFGTAQHLNISAPGISPHLNAPREIAGTMFGNILQIFSYVELLCLPLMLIALLLQLAVFVGPLNFWLWLRILLTVGLLFVAFEDVFRTGPEVRRAHEAWVKAADSQPALIAEKQKAFDALHAKSETNGKIKILVMALLVVVSASDLGPTKTAAKAPPTTAPPTTQPGK